MKFKLDLHPTMWQCHWHPWSMDLWCMHRTLLVHSLAMPQIQDIPIRFPSSMLTHIEQAWKFLLWVAITSHLDGSVIMMILSMYLVPSPQVSWEYHMPVWNLRHTPQTDNRPKRDQQVDTGQWSPEITHLLLDNLLSSSQPVSTPMTVEILQLDIGV